MGVLRPDDIGVEDMKSCIQEWFAAEFTLSGVAILYHELRSEIDLQLEHMLNSIAKDNSSNLDKAAEIQ